ncbi:hypothetical protein [Collinsella intestinalis]|nr:hypothetical protein [Collinsella intestinalis]
MPHSVSLHGVLASITDFWLPLIGWLVAIAVVWFVARLFRR